MVWQHLTKTPGSRTALCPKQKILQFLTFPSPDVGALL